MLLNKWFVQYIVLQVSTESPGLEKTKMIDEESPINTTVMSLNMLKDFLKLNTYYLNIIMYKNIFVDVMLMISIKEGRKILKGIKHLLNFENASNLCTVEGIAEIRSYLLLLKMVIDVLFTTIEKNTHIFVDKNDRLKKFLKLLDSIMDTLNTDIDTRYVKILCSKVCMDLDLIKNPKIVEGNDFNVYYLKEPLRNLYDLFSLQ